MRNLGTLGGSYSRAHAISPEGHIVGYSETAAGNQRAFVWRDGKMYNLGAWAGLQHRA